MLDGMDKKQNKRLLATERGEPQRSGGEPNGLLDERSPLTLHGRTLGRRHLHRDACGISKRHPPAARPVQGPHVVGDCSEQIAPQAGP